ncbi:MAG: carbohydrate ABC transporter permease [Anaerolineaceae bacterium]|nr:carbohydrate ABC transporter permease [Anaerolineaceae bacterium]MCY3905749.1 carbohydrate ABC transporter permease [Anaerolineaceae bacterium]
MAERAQQIEVMQAPARRPGRGRALGYLVLAAGGLLAVLPFLWMLSWSLMTNVEVTVGRVLPTQVYWSNYLTAWDKANFSQFMWNSSRITAITVCGLLLFCVPAAYAFARMQFWGRNVLFAIMLATLMIPDIVTLIPNFLTVVWINRLSQSLFGPAGAWMNNWPSLTIPFMASAFTIFLLRQFFSQIPDELWDAARIDGAGHLRFLLRVVVPLSRPAIMTVVIFSFIGSWNALLWPLLVIQTDEWRPVAFGLTKFVQADAGDEFHLQMAASVIMILPILLLYFFAQKQFTVGIATTGTRG